MATYTGTLQTDGLFFLRPNDSTSGIVRTDPSAFLQAFYGKGPSYGGFTEKAEVVLATESNPGFKQVSFVDDFYNRFHFTPRQLDFGAISADTERTLNVWNAYFQDVTLNSIDIDSTINVALTAGDAPPVVFPALGSENYTFTAYLAGPVNINTETVFPISTGRTYRVPTIGDRAIIQERRPNWRDPVVENLAFQTEIVSVSRSGREQRRALRGEPRRGYTYTVTTYDEPRRALDGLLTRWRRRTALVPIDPYRAVLAAPALATDTVLTLTRETPFWAAAKVQVRFVHREISGTRVGRIASVGASSITLDAPLGVAAPAGTEVILLVTARLENGTSVDQVTSNVAEAELAFEAVPGADPKYTPPAAALTLGGYELFLTKPNWSSAARVQWDHVLEEVDFGRGTKSFFEPVDFAAFTMQHVFTGRRDGDIRKLRDFFFRQRGMAGEFFAPTWANDLEPIQPLELNGRNIRVRGQQTGIDYENQTTHGAVLVELRDGTLIPRLVDVIYPVSDVIGNDSVVQVTTAWEATYPVADVVKISWLMRSRLATDRMSINWITDEIASTQLTFQTLEHLA